MLLAEDCLSSFTTKGLHSGVDGFTCFLPHTVGNIPHPLSYPAHTGPGTLWGLRSQPQGTLTGATHGSPGSQVVKVTRQKASAIPGSRVVGQIPFQKCPDICCPGRGQALIKKEAPGAASGKEKGWSPGSKIQTPGFKRVHAQAPCTAPFPPHPGLAIFSCGKMSECGKEKQWMWC